MNIKVTIKKELEETREISIPAFFKNATGFFAVLDEATQVTLTLLPTIGYTNIRHGTLDQKDIAEAYRDMELSTEEDFLEAYNKAHESIRLSPKINVGMLYDEEKVSALRNSISI